MSTKAVAVGALLIGLLVGGGAIAILTGVGPFSGGGEAGASELTEFPTSTGTPYNADGSASSGDGSGSGTGDDASGAPFSFTIDSIEKCGQTCRDVTATLTNEQNDTATGVTVYTRIYAGNSTDASDLIWEGRQDIGTLEAGGSATETQRVELGYGEAYQVEQNDGWITVVTTVDTDDQTVTFEDQRNVT